MLSYEFNAQKKSIIMWVVALTAICFFMMTMYPMFSKASNDLFSGLSGIGQDFMKAFGVDFSNFGSISGFYGFIFLYIMVAGSVQALIYGMKAFNREWNDKTADFIFTKPVTRTHLFNSKVCAVFLSLLTTNVVFVPASLLIGLIFAGKGSWFSSYFLISLSLFLVQMIFMSIGVITGVVFDKIKSVSSVSLGIMFMFFTINIVSSLTEDKLLRVLSPFRYFPPGEIIINGGYDVHYVVLTFVLAFILLFLSRYMLLRKDIPSY